MKVLSNDKGKATATTMAARMPPKNTYKVMHTNTAASINA
jgi:hypothetical protein